MYKSNKQTDTTSENSQTCGIECNNLQIFKFKLKICLGLGLTTAHFGCAMGAPLKYRVKLTLQELPADRGTAQAASRAPACEPLTLRAHIQWT